MQTAAWLDFIGLRAVAELRRIRFCFVLGRAREDCDGEVWIGGGIDCGRRGLCRRGVGWGVARIVPARRGVWAGCG